ITTGAHIDTAHHSDIQFETQWSGFATPLLDYRLWQPITLPAGRYKFSIEPGDVDDMQTSRLVVSQGTALVSESKCEANAIAWAPLAEGSLDFELMEETNVCVGIIVNLTGQSSFGIHAFKLEGITVEPLVPTTNPDGIGEIKNEKLKEGKGFSGIYDLSGRKVSEGNLKSGIYIKDGKKQVIK
ncbi:MAG: DUF5013 domain-containing protein, partial [Bacteroidaceae bacterium]|nr:DUF5013 domain-containing protein [Bacteroidaceae bacterium]